MTFLSIFGIVVATLIAIAFGYFLAVSILPLPFRRRFALALASGIGFGICSLLFFVFRRPVFTIESAMLLVLFLAWCRHRVWPDVGKWTGVPLRLPILGVFLAGALGFALTGLFLTVDRMPHGDWDGWNIWNSHARLLNRGGSNWQTILPYTFHGDYPLLTSAVAARYWRYAGMEVPEAGGLLGILLSLSTIAVLGFTLSELRDSVVAILFSLVLVGTPSYLELTADQYADVPLSFFILSTIALIAIHLERKPASSGLLVIAGFTAGCAAWTKNEGSLFILTALVVLLVGGKLRDRFLPFAAGATAPLAAVLFFKLRVAPANDLIANSTYTTLMGILKPERHIMILKHVGIVIRSFGHWAVSPVVPLLAFVAVKGIDRRMLLSSAWLNSAGVLAIMAIGYYFVYLTTPLDLRYHLDTSLDRLMVQLWPSFLLVLGLAARPL